MRCFTQFKCDECAFKFSRVCWSASERSCAKIVIYICCLTYGKFLRSVSSMGKSHVNASKSQTKQSSPHPLGEYNSQAIVKIHSQQIEFWSTIMMIFTCRINSDRKLSHSNTTRKIPSVVSQRGKFPIFNACGSRNKLDLKANNVVLLPFAVKVLLTSFFCEKQHSQWMILLRRVTGGSCFASLFVKPWPLRTNNRWPTKATKYQTDRQTLCDTVSQKQKDKENPPPRTIHLILKWASELCSVQIIFGYRGDRPLLPHARRAPIYRRKYRK